MLTYKQISNEYNIPIRKLNRAVYELKIKGIYIGKEKMFNEQEVEQIIHYRRRISSKYKLYHPRKIKIIQAYFKYGSGTKVAKILNIDRSSVNRAIKEYNNTGEIIVESILNNE